MNSRHTWFWIVLAAGLFAFIYFFQWHKAKPPAGPAKVLPDLSAAAVTAIQVRPGAPGQLSIRAERTNDDWQLTQPLSYPALATNISRLIESLETLVVATYITPEELRRHRNAEQEYGFASPQASIIVQQGDYRAHVLVGAVTTPGDQVFVQVVGREGVYVTDAEWLKTLPRSANDWRDTELVRENLDDFDRLAVTNNSRAFVLQRDVHKVWRMVWPLNSARADNARIHEGLTSLQGLRVREFVSEDPKSDAENFGLAPAALDVAFGTGTNTQMLLQFGKNTPAATNQVYARRAGAPSIFSVDTGPLAPWRSTSVNDFRDSHLLAITDPVASIDVRTDEAFSLQRRSNDTWRVLPEDIPADAELVQQLVSGLANLQIAQFTKDVVNAPDWPEFGLASPARQYIIKSAATDSALSPTNCIIAELDFGVVTNQPDKVYVRRADESSVYAVATNGFANLASKGWQFRERKFWNFSESDIAGLLIRQQGKTRELVRGGDHQWSFAPGFQGIIKDLAVEETVRGLGRTSAVAWVARGEPAPNLYGLAANPYQLTIKLKDGRSLDIQFGSEAPSGNQYAAVTLEGKLWVLEFSWILYRDVAAYLSIL